MQNVLVTLFERGGRGGCEGRCAEGSYPEQGACSSCCAGRYAEEEAVPIEGLLATFERAMHLERAFFSAQPGVSSSLLPTLSPRILAVDFDQVPPD